MYCLFERDTSTYLKGYGQACKDDIECCSNKCQLSTCTQAPCTVDYRNGYCTIRGCTFAASLPHRACPAGSACNKLFSGGLCQKTCSLTSASTCRNNTLDKLGDYECRAWNNLSISGIPLASTSTCDFGTQMSCTFLQASLLNCSNVGTVLNTTQMNCRNLKNQVLSTYNALGFCLDNTASGPVK